MIRFAILAWCAALVAVPAHAQNYAPRDECAAVDGAAAFRTALAAAVAARDDDTLMGLVSDDIILDFGGGSGRDELRMRLNNPNYALWDELDAIMPWGCASDDGERLTMPWFFNKPEGNIDPFEGFLVTGTRVALRDAPSFRSNIVERLSWEAVIIQAQESDPGEFWPVTTTDGRSGYIHRDLLRSFVDYRMSAEKFEGQWRLTVFIAGD